MNNHIGLSFTVENILFAHFLKNDRTIDLDRLGTIEYPFLYDEREFFREDRTVLLADLIKQSLEKLKIEQPSISISIETNLAILKRILLPSNLTAKELQDHVTWDLSESLASPISDYVYHITSNYFHHHDLQDNLVITLPKSVISFFSQVSKLTRYKLQNLSLNQLAAELVLRSILIDKTNGLFILFKIAGNRLETTYLWNGSYLYSNYEKIILPVQTAPFFQSIMEKIKSNIKYIENLFEQWGMELTVVDKIFVYGTGINPELIEMIQKNCSVPVFRLNPMQNITFTDRIRQNMPGRDDALKYVECVGVVLDI
jgi:Tfp pilus assembly PilM family ATPase